MGLLHIPDDRLVDIDKLDQFDPAKVLVLSTGSQGEPMSALALMAAGENKWLKISEGDVVILSSHAIPGNEHSVNKVIDGLCRLGADVVHSGLAAVHVTGHAMQGELKTLLSIARPEFFVPVHGEFRHLSHHARLAIEMGVREANVLLAEDGDVVELSDNGVEFGEGVPAGYLYVDGIVGDVGHGVLRDRRALAEEGVVVVVVTIDAQSGHLLTAPRAHHPRLGARAGGRRAHRRGAGPRAGRGGEGGGGRRGHRLRNPQAPRAPRRGSVRERTHPAPTHDRPRRHGSMIVQRGLGSRRHQQGRKNS